MNNANRVNVTDVVVKDMLPEGFVFVNATKGYAYVAGSKQVSWNAGTLINGTNVTYWIVAKSIKVGTWNNTANVTCHENATNVTTNATVKVVPVILTINKTANVTVVGNNTLVNFTIIVNNTAIVNATNITVKDELPIGFTFVSASAGNVANGREVSWTIDNLANKTSISFWIVARSNAIGKWNNTVNVTYNENNTIPEDNCTVDVVPVNLTINKTAMVNGNISVGESVTFVINITNKAIINATHVIVNDVVPKGFEFVKINVTGYNKNTGVLNIPLIEAGKSFLFNITLKATTNGTLTNYVNVTCSENDTVVKANASVNVTPVVNLTVKKIVDYDDALVRDIVTFTIIVTNNGPSNATNIKIKDVLPAGMTKVDGELEVTIPFLASGNSTNI